MAASGTSRPGFLQWLLAYVREAPRKVQQRLGENIILAQLAILSRPVRAALMVLTLGAGVCVVSLSTAIISGFSGEIERLAFGAYARSLVITPNYLAGESSRIARLSDLDRLNEMFGEDLVEGHAAWRIGRQVPAAYQDQRADITVFGVRGDYRFEADMNIAQGRHLEPEDLDSSRRVCLLGSDAAASLFGGNRAAGQTIRLNGLSCYVQGVFEPGETVIASRYADAVIAPFDAAARYFMPNDHLAPNEASRLTIVLRSRDQLYDARHTADRVLRRLHGVPQSQASPFLFADPNAPTRAMEQQRDLLTRLLTGIAGIAMVASLLAFAGASWTLTEMRRRNIAIQAIHGASYMDILIQFATENLILGLMGGLAGIAAALVIAPLSTTWLGWPAQFDPNVLTGSVLLGTLSGVIAGALSAHRAAVTRPGIAIAG
ncbi:ABC transporter permease [Hyphobacterium sp. HN65]|uniref:ABC transporter permease n=1 Tax=Hyphobacterium lacteum TaxID=3116575 RepID=A0ABU7LPF7_9PROT|nr:ABC transporter permease [Hyphobacterium sp. HN65]MEE2525803.1 ABC transporter permease [Hyphobacterium sp. HN65]